MAVSAFGIVGGPLRSISVQSRQRLSKETGSQRHHDHGLSGEAERIWPHPHSAHRQPGERPTSILRARVLDGLAPIHWGAIRGRDCRGVAIFSSSTLRRRRQLEVVVVDAHETDRPTSPSEKKQETSHRPCGAICSIRDGCDRGISETSTTADTNTREPMNARLAWR